METDMPVQDMTEESFKLVTQGGSFAVLVFIALFLIRNIPKWITDHLDTVKELAKIHKEEAKAQQDMFALQLAAERAMCDRHHENVIQKLEQSNNNTLTAFQTIEKSINQHHEFAVATLMGLKDKKTS
jgi:ABC-type nickel/cobalt efflux system permease component RcnA